MKQVLLFSTNTNEEKHETRTKKSSLSAGSSADGESKPTSKRPGLNIILENNDETIKSSSFLDTIERECKELSIGYTKSYSQKNPSIRPRVSKPSTRRSIAEDTIEEEWKRLNSKRTMINIQQVDDGAEDEWNLKDEGRQRDDYLESSTNPPSFFERMNSKINNRRVKKHIMEPQQSGQH
jgi:hypothetical protein